MCQGFVYQSLIMLSIIINVSSSKILMLPVPYRSQTNAFAVTAASLQEYGHEVTLLLPETKRNLADERNVTAFAYTVPEDAILISSDEMFQSLLIDNANDKVKAYSDAAIAASILCEKLHADDDLMDRLEKQHFDLVLIDGIDFMRCFYTVPYRLGVRYITLTSRHDPWSAGISALPSIEPVPGQGLYSEEPLTFYQRLSSLFQYRTLCKYLPPSVLDDSMIGRVCPTKPKTTFKELYSKSEMWLVNLETIALDTTRVSGSHYQFVAGLGLESPKALPPELEKFVRNARSGFIVVSFGANLKNIPDEMMAKFVETFAQVPEYHVIMRHEGKEPDNLPENIKIMPWLPQGDLLGHPKARALITHGGRDGQLEAVHHAVPLITLPMFGDQFYYAERAAKKGFGVTLDRNSFTTEELLVAVKDVAGGKKYRSSIRHCSERFRSLPAAHDVIAFWAEHVIRFGGSHLKPVSMEVSVWNMFMFDIFTFFMILVLVIYTCILFCGVKIVLWLRDKNELYTKDS